MTDIINTLQKKGLVRRYDAYDKQPTLEKVTSLIFSVTFMNL